MSSDSLSSSIFLARQPIFDNNLNLFAYELLFHSDQSDRSSVGDLTGDIATSKVINHTFLNCDSEGSEHPTNQQRLYQRNRLGQHVTKYVKIVP
jgi:c-di-GMP-related signal transduction protein